ncbi:sensor histidine kinase [Donghicola mangrovi]|uniref:histidine kinase n=1 Tax=Donghicola mangrovi TaxID=2729614 RepID=A0A850QF17_9RHOB|nr:sensor histidine kinase [Donghicola mangrovi]NVO25538.1 sensor histidine kinase [Donghicola mangrovi]
MTDAPRPDAQRSLSSRVVTGVLSLLFVGGIIVAIASFAYGRQAAREAYDRLLLGAANDIAESISVLGGEPLADLPISAFKLLALAPDDRIAYAVRGPQGQLLTGNDFARPPTDTRVTTGNPHFFDHPMQGDTARFVTVYRRFAERDFSGTVSVTVGQTIAARNAMALSLTRDALIASLVAGVALMLLAALVIRNAMEPLNRIASELLDRDPYDLTPMDRNVPAEVSVMIDAMNRFMLRLDRQFSSMRNLISDTAHQLRTPVAAIRAQAELIGEETNDDARQQMVTRLTRRSRSLGELLDQMLSRALVIHRTDSAPRLPIDLRDIALEVVDSRDHELLAPETEVELRIGPDEVIVLADEISLTEAAKNMFNNALRHGASPVTIGVTVEGTNAALWVEDAGNGPPPEILDRIGERFERSSASSGRSAGLGLSIVRAVASAFQGEVRMAPGENGFRVTLLLPLRPTRTGDPQ